MSQGEYITGRSQLQDTDGNEHDNHTKDQRLGQDNSLHQNCMKNGIGEFKYILMFIVILPSSRISIACGHCERPFRVMFVLSCARLAVWISWYLDMIRPYKEEQDFVRDGKLNGD